jgi:hypothetical protein
MSKRHTFSIAVLIILIVIPSSVTLVSSASGHILVNSKTASTPGQQVQAGGNINLYFGQVTWTGTQVYLLLSNDYSEQITPGDLIYTPTFQVADLLNPSTKAYTSGAGSWTVGNNWINGTIAPNVPVGNYTIKAFDLGSATVARTDIFIMVYSVIYSSTLQLSPQSGPGGIPVQFAGSGYPPSSQVTISVLDPTFSSWNFLCNTTADSQGRISCTNTVPDLRKSVGAGDYAESYFQISYRAEIHGVIYCYADYNQYSRGLKRVGNQTANGLYGNGTNLASTVNLLSGDSVTISGKWFSPGSVIYVRWDGKAVVGTVTGSQWANAQIIGTAVADSTGAFVTTATIPVADAGEHYLSIEDSQTKVITKIYVSGATLSLSPSSGAGGALVTFSGSRYPPSTPITISGLDSTFNTWSTFVSTTSDASGKIQVNAIIPDLRKSLGSYDSSETSSPISFRAESGGTVYCKVDYTQFSRGLKRVGEQTANGLYGNGSDLTPLVTVKPGDSITVSGKWFHVSDAIYVRWDGKSVVGTVTGNQWLNAQIIGTSVADSTGAFVATCSIPNADNGVHYLSVEDSQAKVIVKVSVGSGQTGSPTKLPSNINLSCNSTTAYFGFRVNINGKLTCNQTAISGQPIQLAYSTTGGSTWENLTYTFTDGDGRFSASWMPPTSGSYLIKATFEGNTACYGTSEVVTLAAAPYLNQNIFAVSSNSTVSALSFDSTNNKLSFTVEGPSGTTGYVDVSIAKTLVADAANIQVLVDNVNKEYTVTSTADSWFIHFTYSHSTHTVNINLQSTDNPTASPTPAPENSQTPTPSTGTETPTQTSSAASPQPSETPTIPEFLSIAAVAAVIVTSTIILVLTRRKQFKINARS